MMLERHERVDFGTHGRKAGPFEILKRFPRRRSKGIAFPFHPIHDSFPLHFSVYEALHSVVVDIR
jgi:hypothetical protein